MRFASSFPERPAHADPRGADQWLHAAPPFAADGKVRVIDPERARQDAIEAGLVVHHEHPLNCETALGALISGALTPNAHFYVRNHFHIPRLDMQSWRLTVRGRVRRP